MPEVKTFSLSAAQDQCRRLALEHIMQQLAEEGVDPETELAGCRAKIRYLPLTSSYRLMLEVSYRASNWPQRIACYFLLLEQWNHRYRIEDLQVQPKS